MSERKFHYLLMFDRDGQLTNLLAYKSYEVCLQAFNGCIARKEMRVKKNLKKYKPRHLSKEQWKAQIERAESRAQ